MGNVRIFEFEFIFFRLCILLKYSRNELLYLYLYSNKINAIIRRINWLNKDINIYNNF